MTALDTVLGKLDRVTETTAGWSAQCPAHPDRSPSLSISHGDGKVLVNCHAGCSPADVVAAIGLGMSDLFDEPAESSRRRIEQVYPYHDANSELLYEVVRYQPKDFRQRRPDGNGGHVWSLQGVDRVLYRLPAVLAAVAAGEVVYIAEGEKDADALTAAGVCATTSPQGAGSWKHVAAKARQILKGAAVVIVHDQDAPGIAHAREVARSLADVATIVVAKPVGKFKDVSDHLGAGHTATSLVKVAGDKFKGIPDLIDWLADNDGKATDDGPREPEHFKRWSISELLAADLTFEWDITGMMVRPTYGLDTGELKTLKSYVGTARAIGLAAGVPVLGHWAVPERRRVLFYVAEGGRVPFTRRLIRLAEAHGVEIADLDGWLEPIFDAGPLDSTTFRDTLRNHLDEFDPAFVHLDPLYAFQSSQVDTHRVDQQGRMLSEVQHICGERDATLWITAHMNQTGTGFDLKRIAGAGTAEWGDSWMLLKHCETPDVEHGRFKLAADIGSRQWGGASYSIDLNIGRFDADTGQHDGPITFQVHRGGTDGDGPDPEATKRLKGRRAVFTTMRKSRKPLTRTEIAERSTGASAGHIRAEIAVMIDDGILVEHGIRKPTKGGPEAPMYRLADGHDDA